MQTRAFIIDNGRPRRISWVAFERLYSGHPKECDLLPEYAGRTMKMVQATISDDCATVSYPRVRFDSHGAMDQVFLARARRYAVDTLGRPLTTGNVVMAAALFRRRGQEREFRWHPHPELDTAIRTMIGMVP